MYQGFVRSFGAGGRGRTDTVLPPLDFESSTSANSITPARILLYTIAAGLSSKFFTDQCGWPLLLIEKA